MAIEIHLDPDDAVSLVTMAGRLTSSDPDGHWREFESTLRDLEIDSDRVLVDISRVTYFDSKFDDPLYEWILGLLESDTPVVLYRHDDGRFHLQQKYFERRLSRAKDSVRDRFSAHTNLDAAREAAGLTS